MSRGAGTATGPSDDVVVRGAASGPGGLADVPDEESDRQALEHSVPDRLLREAARCGDPGRARRLREEAVRAAMPVARSIAVRYRDRGESLDDLVQVAYLGLVKAVDGFDAEHPSDFLGYATPSISGEVRRWFRDRGWDVRPPRRVQELRSTVGQVVQELTQTLGRAPTVREIAERAASTPEQVTEALVAASAYSSDSLDAPVGRRDDVSLGDTLPEPDDDLDGVEDRVALAPLLAALPPRDRHVLALRFYRGLTQSEIAEDIGVTQMQVSRIISKSLTVLRRQLLAG
ncbi:SigB/SigF/SigG family RNA polymerase sigma factor [Thalassiella azotivora]